MSEAELAVAIAGEVITEGLIRIERTIPLTATIGNTSLSGLGTPQLLPGETQSQPAIYIDTETTGLSGGSGTLAFLVGFAHITGTKLKLTQLLLTRFSAESELLSLLKQVLPRNHRLVSYNGKSYDLPLLITRFRMQGIKPDLVEYEHLDLLHPVRRLFAKRWEDCRLTTVERKLLGFQRLNDLPGSEAPEAWFSYLRAGDGDKLIKVIEHNRQDILSLAVIHTAVVDATLNPIQRAVDIYGFSRWLVEVNEEQAIGLLHANKESLCDDGKRLLAHLYRRAERWVDATPLWEELAKMGCIESIERLAKYHEHVSKNLEVALHYANKLPGSASDKLRSARILQKLSSTLIHP